jgi:hypothetical protein
VEQQSYTVEKSKQGRIEDLVEARYASGPGLAFRTQCPTQRDAVVECYPFQLTETWTWDAHLVTVLQLGNDVENIHQLQNE